MKKQVRTLSVFMVILLLVSISVNVVLALDNGQADPGSEQNPLVSKDYVDDITAKSDAVIKQLQTEIETLKSKVSETGAGSEGFKVVELEAGHMILTGSGTEILLRKGKAYSINGQYGGLADTTAAKDLAANVLVAENHLLISSRDDGRGMKASIKCYLLVRGAYKIEKAAGDVTPPVQENGGETDVKTATVNASSLNIRSGPGTENSKVGGVVKGEKVTVLEKSGDWHKVKTSSGIVGWVLSKFLTF